jgi:hypothetical protein
MTAFVTFERSKTVIDETDTAAAAGQRDSGPELSNEESKRASATGRTLSTAEEADQRPDRVCGMQALLGVTAFAHLHMCDLHLCG